MADQKFLIGGNTYIDLEEISVAGSLVNRQRMRLAGLGAAEIADVRNAFASASDYGLVTRLAGIGHAEDAAHVSGDLGIMALGTVNTTAATRSSTNGDYVPIALSTAGDVYVRGRAVDGDNANFPSDAIHSKSFNMGYDVNNNAWNFLPLLWYLGLQTNPLAYAYQETFTASGNGATRLLGQTDVAAVGLARQFGIQVHGVGGAPSAWGIVLEGALDSAGGWTTILTHTETTPGNGKMLWTTLAFPCLAYRVRVATLTLNPASSIVVTSLAVT